MMQDLEKRNSGAADTLARRLAEALPKLKPEQVAEVSPKLAQRTFGPGEEIIRQGDSPERFYIVLRGEIEVLHENLKGELGTVARRGPGAYFGETGLLQNRARNATVRAHESGDVEVLAMERADFLELMEASRATEMHVAQEMIKRLIKLADAQP
jgi:CRP-like cAMP-binding protein